MWRPSLESGTPARISMKFFVELKITLEKLRYISYNRSGNGRRLWEIKKGYMQFQVEFYETVDGKIPIRDFLDSLEPKMNAKMVGLMEILEEKGYSLREPYSAPLEDGIFELRAVQGSNISRALFFFYIEGRIIITHGFIKKTQKTPKAQIELAKKYRADYLKRQQIKVEKKTESR